MPYLTEQEQLERFEYYTLQLEERILEGEDPEAVVDEVPYVSHLCKPGTFEATYANKIYEDYTGKEFEEIQQGWMKFVLTTIHPSTVNNILKFLPGLYERKNVNQTISFIQYVKNPKDNRYFPLITLTKPTKLDNGMLLWVQPRPDDFGKHTKKMERIVRMDEFKLKHFKRFQQLTNREVDVLKLLANGCNNPQIAEQLFLSRSTVETHRKNLKRKLELNSLRDLMRYAFAFNLVEV
ncbi:helix-turn-helix transcriptional regulator [Aliifodinibius sp. S!AR15-10]|uniref:response regulator transcription factor n=1 Tax=Aliifodinibius sp. S!AR15-10 TaxID=2950437 RepID=UPI00286319F7|nr:helix-turn-helix transcriptional regulator [Aliifodinibius sp. S!AR15-10]MDR8391658.1 helix-turn-helix transcriptional regulator [Aliifodinibius sp. S!AR15-10]